MTYETNMAGFVNIHRALLSLYIHQFTHAENLEIYYGPEYEEVKEARKEAEFTKRQVKQIEALFKETYR